jgi:hypothetical protein
MHVEPQKEHQWLQKLVGEWTYESDAETGPGKPHEKFTGTETVRSLGGVWILCEGSGEMPGGGTGKTIMTLGYDPQKKRFVGTFIGSMMANLWLYEGSLDADGKLLTLDSEGPSFSGDGRLAKYKDAMDVKSDDHRVFSSSVLGEDGKWLTFMTAHYRRKK